MTGLGLLATAASTAILLSGSTQPVPMHRAASGRHAAPVARMSAVVHGAHALSPLAERSHSALQRPGSLVVLSGTSQSGIYRRGTGLAAIGGQPRTEYPMAIDGATVGRKR
jgi:hypothetical protein